MQRKPNDKNCKYMTFQCIKIHAIETIQNLAVDLAMRIAQGLGREIHIVFMALERVLLGKVA